MQDARKKAGLSKRALSLKLGEPHNLMQRIESLERDISVAEFMEVSAAMGVEPDALMREIMRRR